MASSVKAVRVAAALPLAAVLALAGCGSANATPTVTVPAPTSTSSRWTGDDRIITPLTRNTPTVRLYTVKRGDTLWSIAVSQTGDGHNWKRIQRANHLKGTKIRPGQRLVIVGS